jgi:peptidyl-prolyl cis-trans isomerase D
MEDKIAIKIIDAPTIEVDEEEIKNYWEKHKDNYKSELSYDIGYYYVPVDGEVSENELNSYYEEHKLEYTDSNGTILPLTNVKEKVEKALLAKKRKRDAIITMKKLKKGELQFKTISNITLNNSYIPLSLMQKLVETKFLKPSLTEKGWLIAKLIKVNKPVILPYEKAKELAKEDLIKEKRVAVLEKLAKKNLKQFKGQEIGFVGKDDVMKLQMLSVEDATDFLTSLFASKTAEGYTLLPKDAPNKVVVYKIKEQKLLDDNKYKKYKDNIGQYTKNLKREEFENSLIEELKKLYQSQIKVYMKI